MHDDVIFLQCSNPIRVTRADQRRQHLLETARDLFIANGFHGTGMAQLAQASGVKVGQIYRDFANKEAIIAAIALRDLTGFLDESGLEDAIRRCDLLAIRQWIVSFVGYDDDDDGYRLMPEIAAESMRNPRIANLQTEIVGRVRNALLSALAAVAPGADMEGPRAEAADLITTLGGGLCQWMLIERQNGRDPRLLCSRLQRVVERELDALLGTDSVVA